MKRLMLLGVAVLTVVPDLAAAQEQGREGRPGGERPGGGGNPGGQRTGGGNPGGQRPAPVAQPARPNPGLQIQPGRPGGDSRPGRPGDQQVRPGRPGGDDSRPGRPGGPQIQPGRPGGENRPGRPGGDNNRPGFGDNRPGRPGGDDNRPGRPGAGFQRPPSYRPPPGYWNGNNWNRPRVSWRAYNYPRGYSYRRWSVGLLLPALFFSSAYYYNDYQQLGLYAPPYGYHWVRYGPDLLLVEDGTRRIVDTRYGVFA